MTPPRMTHERSAFREGLDQLEARIDWIPPGWQPLYFEVRRRLIGVQSDARARIRLDGPWPDTGVLHIEARGADPVVAGILRKTARASRYTCCECGRVGKPREIDGTDIVLCSPCAGLRLLESDLQGLGHLIKQQEAKPDAGWLDFRGLSHRLVALIRASCPDAIEEGPGGTWRVHIPAAKPVIDRALRTLQNSAGRHS